MPAFVLTYSTPCRFYISPACFVFLAFPFVFLELPKMMNDERLVVQPYLLLGSAFTAFGVFPSSSHPPSNVCVCMIRVMRVNDRWCMYAHVLATDPGFVRGLGRLGISPFAWTNCWHRLVQSGEDPRSQNKD